MFFIQQFHITLYSFFKNLNKKWRASKVNLSQQDHNVCTGSIKTLNAYHAQMPINMSQ